MSIHHENLYKEKEPQQLTMPAEQQEQQQNQSMTKQQPLQEQAQNPVGQIQLPQAVTLHIENKEAVREAAVSGRTIAQLLLEKDSFTGDSDMMKDAKNSVRQLEALLQQPLDQENMNGYMEQLEAAYLLAISHCQYYCDHRDPFFENGKQRKQAVADELASLRREQAQLATAKQLLTDGSFDLQEKNGQDLLEAARNVMQAGGQEQVSAQTGQTDPMSKLSFSDFARMLGTHNRGQIEFDGQNLRMINNGKFSMSRGVESVQNYHLASQFLKVVGDRLEQGGVPFTPAMRIRLFQQLGMSESLSIRPISRSVVGEIIAMVNDLTSPVDKVLREGKEAVPAEHRLALAVEEQLSGSRQDETDARTKSEHEKVLRKQILSILEEAKNQGVKVPELNKHQMDNLVKGNINLLRGQAFRDLENTYKAMCRLNGGRPADFNRLAGDRKLINRVMALSIARTAAVTSEGALAADYELRKYLSDAVFRYHGQPQLEQAFTKSRVPMFAADGDAGLTALVEQKLPESQAWEGNSVRVKKGMDGLADLSRSLQRLAQLQKVAFNDGLAADEAHELRVLGTHIQDVLTGQEHGAASPEDMELVARELERTRFGAGYDHLRGLLRDNFSFAEAANRIADAATIQEQTKLRQEKSPLQSQYDTSDEQNESQILISESEALLGNLTGMDRDVAAVLLLTKEPSSLIKKDQDQTARSLLDLRYILRTFMDGGARSEDLNIAGVNVRLTQRENGVLEMQVGRQRIPMPYQASLLASRLELDISGHVDRYGKKETFDVLMDAVVDAQKNITEQEGEANRTLFLNVLEQTVQLPAAYFNNVPIQVLSSLATHVLNNMMDQAGVKEEVEKINAMNPDMINESDTLEMLRIFEQEKKEKKDIGKVNMPAPQKQQEKPGEIQWTKDEAEIKDLLADLIFSKDTWKADMERREPADRIRLLFHSHAALLAKMILDPKILDGMLNKLQMPGAEDMTEGIRNQINELFASEAVQKLREFAGTGWFASTKLTGALSLALSDKMTPEMIKNLAKMTGMPADELQEMRQTMMNQFRDLDADIDSQVSAQVNAIQEKVTEAVNTVFDAKEEDKDKKEDSKKSKTLSQILEEASKGKEGQGKFMKTVLTNYFRDARNVDRRAMMASALRDMKPMQVKAGEQADQEAVDRQMGIFLGGFLKGAGPLMHKMLQGMPTSSMPEILRTAVADMKSNLSPIPEEIVRSRLLKMVKASKKTISKITVTRSLGAASIGQAFLCRIYGTGLEKEGTEVVIKMLRPDVRNHMEREKEQMLRYARETDEQGGMLATYQGQLERIEEELDLRIEAKNVKLGEVYNRGANTVQTMKLSNLVNPDTNALVLEKAPGTTVDKYLEEVKQEHKRLMDEIQNMGESGSGYEVLEKLGKMQQQLIKRQKYVTELVRKWILSGVYDEGFYHGDLHAGNIMVDDEKATVIDFGNATQLTKDQQIHIMHMLCAAAAGNLEGFRHGFHMLLSKKSEATYQSKKTLLNAVFQDAITTDGREQAGLRIAVALLKAQELGLELPAAVYNFSQCQLRLQNTVTEMNESIEMLKNSIQSLLVRQPEAQTDLLTEVQPDIAQYLIEKNRWKDDSKNNPKPENIETTVKKKLHTELNKETLPNDLLNRKIPYKIRALKNMGEQMDNGANIFRIGIYNETYRTLLIEQLNEAVDSIEHVCGKEDEALVAQYHELQQRILQYLDEKEPPKDKLTDCYTQLASMSRGRLADAFLQNLSKYETLTKNGQASEAERKEVETQLVEQTEQLYHMNGEGEGMLGAVCKKLEMDDQSAFADEMKSWFAQEDHHGTELKKAYDDYQTAKKNGQWQERIRQEQLFINLYEQALLQRVRTIDRVDDERFETEVDEFYETMGKVMLERAGATIHKLGFMGLWRYGSILGSEDKSRRKAPEPTKDEKLRADGNEVIDILGYTDLQSESGIAMIKTKESMLETMSPEEFQERLRVKLLGGQEETGEWDSDSLKGILLSIPKKSKVIKQSRIKDWCTRLERIVAEEDADALKTLQEEIHLAIREIRQVIGVQSVEERQEQLRANADEINTGLRVVHSNVAAGCDALAQAQTETDAEKKEELLDEARRCLNSDSLTMSLNLLKAYPHVIVPEKISEWEKQLKQISKKKHLDAQKLEQLVADIEKWKNDIEQESATIKNSEESAGQ